MKATYRATVARGGDFQSDDPLGDQIAQFDEELGLSTDSKDFAMEQLRMWHELTGKPWDDTPVTEGFVVDAKGNKTATQNVGMAELNVEYTDMRSLNRELAKKGR